MTDTRFLNSEGTTRITRPTSLSVAVLTYLRPEELHTGLTEVVAQVLQLNAHPAALVRARVLVVDNDPEASAREIVSRFDPEVVEYVVETTPGIAAARNRALRESEDVDLLVFIDDDERPREGWLEPLIDTWRATAAAAVMGLVISTFSKELSPWVAAGSFFWRPTRTTGTEIFTAATNNLLLDLEQVRALGLRFDNSLGLSGGEDNLFSRQLVRRGARIVWCNEAVADDLVPESRTTRQWVLARSWSHGNSTSIVELRLAGSPAKRILARAIAITRGVARVVGGCIRYSLGLVTGNLRHQARGLRTAYRGGGMISGALGFEYQEYGRNRS